MTFAILLVIATISTGFTSTRPARASAPDDRRVGAPAHPWGDVRITLGLGSIGDAQPQPRDDRHPPDRALLATMLQGPIGYGRM